MLGGGLIARSYTMVSVSGSTGVNGEHWKGAGGETSRRLSLNAQRLVGYAQATDYSGLKA